ncbi:MAG: NPCBM/NEW2 domain-containing protein [Planctomycetaceae bacterium]|nr:NPCBM/NEW2 domain-containing protein [Planctomycetaceae bacterium]
MKRIVYFLAVVLTSFGFFSFSFADETFLDQLDLSQTTCGWQKTNPNKSVDNNPLLIGGQKFQRGVGTHAPGEIIVALPQSKGKFTAMVGIDDEVGTKGHAEFLVYLDNKQIWRSGFMSGGQPAKYCEIPFQTNNRQIRLAVVTGPEGYAFDHTNWADAKIEYEHKNSLAKIHTLKPTAQILDGNGNIIDPTDEIAREYFTLQKELKKGINPKRSAQALRPEATFLPNDKNPVDVVLRRTKALLEYLKKLPNTPTLENETKKLEQLETSHNKPNLTEENSIKLFAEIVALREKIALQNPLLDFSDILFIKRHYNPEPEKQGNHMVDQFFGFHAVSGGGLFVLENAFEPAKRKVKNLLENSAVQNEKRLKGKKLDTTWGYLAPALSFDATKILFAAADTSEPRHSYVWTENNCYHLFEVNTDGSNLVQLTDGHWNDIDPCYLPNGRIAFISERRGGFGRCHARPCPSYTLHSMLPDGNDIVTLSPHETNEWAPMVDQNGMIIYTRWDYVDRGFNQAHHPWITYPDGRDPRAIQGNYSEDERSRPHFETSFRQIPNSHKLIGTAQGHHTQYFGSIILLDPNVPDDEEDGDPMAPLRRITPEQPFPEVENRTHSPDAANYGQPFPINEDFYLVVYDSFSGMNKGHDNNYGIYLLDSFGNKILLYRDPAISCQSPIALKPRAIPPIIPHKTLVGLPPDAKNSVTEEKLPTTGVVGVINVHETNRPFPAGTKIKELRVVQILPKTTPNANVPWIGYGNETSARKVLGTVPVESDGSVRFELPVNIPVYFQVLDENGVAVQTMRSATYVKPGETLTCLGCHEGRQRSTAKPTVYPTAFRKPVATITPEMTGSNPFNYPTLVQPILDKHCVSCHEKEADAGKTFRLGRGKPVSNLTTHFFESYIKLRPYVFVYKGKYQKASPELMDPLPSRGDAWNSFTISRTFPGQFGANASPLWKLLKKGHYNVSLTPEEYRNIALWLDNNADFYGAFELKTLEAQRNGQNVQPTLE